MKFEAATTGDYYVDGPLCQCQRVREPGRVSVSVIGGGQEG